MYLTIQNVIMMVEIVVDLMWTQIGARNVTALQIVQVLLIWLAMVSATMKPTLQIVTTMVEIAAESVSTQIFAPNAYAKKEENQRHVSFFFWITLLVL